MSLTNVAEQAALEAVVTGAYVALFTSPPDETGAGGIEVSGGGYARQAVSWSFVQGEPTEASNSAQLAWTATADWGTVTHAVLMTAAAGGVAQAVLELVDPNDPTIAMPQMVNSGNDVQFAVGELVVSLA